MYEMEGDSPLHLGWAMELAGVLVRVDAQLTGWVPDDMLRLNWDLPRFTTRVSSELQAYGFRWPPVDDEGPAVVPLDVYCGLEAALTWCEGDRFNWVLAAWFACEFGGTRPASGSRITRASICSACTRGSTSHSTSQPGSGRSRRCDRRPFLIL
jgi:hypothetical protein